jgi:hypothetical protein
MNQDPTKRLLIGIVGLVSQWEREQLVEKLKIARKHIKDKFGRCEGRKGFADDPNRPEEKLILSRMIVLRDDGKKPDQIAQILNSEGVPTRGTKHGKSPWHPSTINKILARNRK